ncbi:MAG: AAA family ATPase [Chitinispirillaceae bacterium]|nr:AAA family ATPase [Chitinispirillaceae bacterium]
MSEDSLSLTHDVIETVSSSSDSDVVIIREKESGDKYILKSLKNRPAIEKGGIDRKIRFKRELDFISSLDHPNIAKPAFVPGSEGNNSIAYPYRNGKTLSLLLEERPAFFPLEALRLIIQLLNALEYIHARGIVHCDINPNNLFIDDAKGLQLLDFGMSLTEEEAAHLAEGRIIGTMPYISPEQMGFTGFKIDTRSDLYCAGLVLYRLLADKLPFELQNNTIEELLHHAIRTTVAPIRTIPSALNAIVLKALKPTPGERYQTASGFNHDLQAAIGFLKNEHQGAFYPGLNDAIVAINLSRRFVARSREVDMLKNSLTHVLQGHHASFCFFGKSGIGKTEIVREFRRITPEKDFRYVSAKCNSFSSRQPYSILRHLALDCISRINSSGKEESNAFLKMADKLLIDYSGVICKMLPEMRQFFREVRPIDIVEPEKEADRTAHVLFTLFTAFCAFKPLIVFIDDLQWIDRVSFEIIRRLLKNATPCMIITSYRTENYEGDLLVFEFDLRRIGMQKLVPVMPFTRSEIKDLIVSRFGEIADTGKLADLLIAKTDCSPFALTEAFRFLVNNSFLSFGQCGWSLSGITSNDLPEHLDPIELILDKIKDLSPDEVQWLETASLAEGKFQTSLIDTISGFSSAQSSIIADNCENAGLLIPRFGGGYRFAHDRIQESVHSNIPNDKQLLLYEKFGEAYETMADVDKDLLFLAAESYLKSKNLSKAILLCYKAARQAVDNVALDIASRYFTSTQLMVSQCAGAGMTPPIDVVKMQIEFGDVLMLTGRNEQALKMFNGILHDNKVSDRMVILDIKYKVGSIYHNMGDFNSSINHFFDALKQLEINYHSNILLICISLFYELLKQFLFSLGLKYFFAKKSNIESIFTVRILNKLAYSLFFKNILLEQLAHFKALNIADTLIDCAEKAEAYSCHIVASFLMLMKKRAISYYYKAINISKNINRKDSLGLSQSFGGVTYYYNSKWQIAANSLSESINTYKSIGDLWGQVVPLETSIFIELQTGNFHKCEPLIENLIKLDETCKDLRSLALAHIFSAYLNYLKKNDSYTDWATIIEERENVLSEVPLVKTICNITIAKKFILTDQLQSAYDLSDITFKSIKQNNLLQEYVASAFSDRCEILFREYYNRHYAKEPEKQLNLTDRELFRELRQAMRQAFLRGIMYPAHLGAAFRALAWYNVFKKRRRTGRYFFCRAIDHHHKLDMKYEEAKSLRDFALFYEQSSEPGIARDYFNQAYLLFNKCGAAIETSRLEDKVDRELLQTRKREEIRADTSTGSFEAADQIRMDTLYEASLSLTCTDNMDELLRRIVLSLIKATGAQYGLLLLDGDETHEPRELALDFENCTLGKDAIAFSSHIIDAVRRERRIVMSRDPSNGMADDHAPIEPKESVLCVPLVRGEKYYGCVYLANTLVAGLFSGSASKAAQIIAGQAGFLIENRHLMEEYKRLNARLEEKVKEQTRDIREKHEQLSDSNLKLIESERMKGLLTGTIVHDIKNFAAGISGNIRLLSYKHKDDPRTLRSVDLVVESCSDIVNLSSNLLDISKMEEGRLTLQQRRLYFEELAVVAQKFGRNVLFDEKKITTTITPPQGDFAIMADPYLVERVIQNLYSNAAKYTSAGGSVAISFETTAEENVLTFHSSGPIIPDEQKAVIFEKYSRVDGRQSQYSKGLGLFFCKMVMTAHQGRIWLDTNEQGNYFRLGFRKL